MPFLNQVDADVHRQYFYYAKAKYETCVSSALLSSKPHKNSPLEQTERRRNSFFEEPFGANNTVRKCCERY